jgi:hypothetical protein
MASASCNASNSGSESSDCFEKELDSELSLVEIVLLSRVMLFVMEFVLYMDSCRRSSRR